jgi:hypothetical protein
MAALDVFQVVTSDSSDAISPCPYVTATPFVASALASGLRSRMRRGEDGRPPLIDWACRLAAGAKQARPGYLSSRAPLAHWPHRSQGPRHRCSHFGSIKAELVTVSLQASFKFVSGQWCPPSDHRKGRAAGDQQQHGAALLQMVATHLLIGWRTRCAEL